MNQWLKRKSLAGVFLFCLAAQGKDTDLAQLLNSFHPMRIGDIEDVFNEGLLLRSGVILFRCKGTSTKELGPESESSRPGKNIWHAPVTIEVLRKVKKIDGDQWLLTEEGYDRTVSDAPLSRAEILLSFDDDLTARGQNRDDGSTVIQTVVDNGLLITDTAFPSLMKFMQFQILDANSFISFTQTYQVDTNQSERPPSATPVSTDFCLALHRD